MIAKDKATAWYLLNIPKPGELDSKVEATLEYVKRFSEPDEEGEWVVFAYEIVSGSAGQFTVSQFIEELTGAEGIHDKWDIDERMSAFDTLSRYLADEFNKHTKLRGKFYVGHNEADGSLGVFYAVKA
jgi:hypothetical protein